ncbi:hypothetical protein CN918_30990 [Priestia megaterium]|nr:hypothetical protein CN918_30990 [Priestia megaterium]
MSTEEKSIEEMKREFKEALEKFIPLRNQEEDGDVPLTHEQNEEYMELLEQHLLPLREALEKAGEYHFVNQKKHQFSFII